MAYMYGDGVYHRTGVSFGTLIYVLIGIVVALQHGYMAGLTSISAILNMILAVLLWPLLLFGVGIHLNLGV